MDIFKRNYKEIKKLKIIFLKYIICHICNIKYSFNHIYIRSSITVFINLNLRILKILIIKNQINLNYLNFLIFTSFGPLQN